MKPATLLAYKQMLRQGEQAVNTSDMSDKTDGPDTYQLSDQVGYNMRRAYQRHVAIFSRLVDDVTPTQLAVLARLYEKGPLSQNKLGRLTAMDSATIKGVVERLRGKGLTLSRPDPKDQRLRLVELTSEGRTLFRKAHEQALRARSETLAPLTDAEAAHFESLLAKLV